MKKASTITKFEKSAFISFIIIGIINNPVFLFINLMLPFMIPGTSFLLLCLQLEGFLDQNLIIVCAFFISSIAFCLVMHLLAYSIKTKTFKKTRLVLLLITTCYFCADIIFTIIYVDWSAAYQDISIRTSFWYHLITCAVDFWMICVSIVIFIRGLQQKKDTELLEEETF
jgi:hypothetical protein